MTSLAYGMTPSGNVADALRRVLPLFHREWITVIRSIDSASSQDDLAKALTFHKVPHNCTNGNICFSVGDLQRVLDADVFTGFDEVWIVSGSSPSFDLGHLPSATSDATDFSARMPKDLRLAIEKTNCILVVGDGCGLNYATTDEQICEAIVLMPCRKPPQVR